MKKKIAIPIVIVIVAAVVAVVIVLRNKKKWQKYELVDEAKDYVQFWDLSGEEVTPSSYATGGQYVFADTSSPKTIINPIVSGVEYAGTYTFIPVRKVLYDDGTKMTLKPDISYMNELYLVK